MNAKEFFFRLGKALYRLDYIYAELAKNKELSSSELWVLYALNDGSIHTQIEISRDWDLPKTTVNTVISNFQKRGFVELVHIEGTRRKMAINLTENGKKFADEALKDIYELEKQVFERLDSKDYLIIETLEKMPSIYKSIMKRN